jgi:hypothetical protein
VSCFSGLASAATGRVWGAGSIFSMRFSSPSSFILVRPDLEAPARFFSAWRCFSIFVAGFYLHSQLYSLVKHHFSLICVLLVLDFLPADHRSDSCFVVPNFSWRLDSVNRVEVFVSRAHSVFRIDVARGPVLVPQRFSLPFSLHLVHPRAEAARCCPL